MRGVNARDDWKPFADLERFACERSSATRQSVQDVPFERLEDPMHVTVRAVHGMGSSTHANGFQERNRAQMAIDYTSTPTPANGQPRSAAALTATFNNIRDSYNSEVGNLQTSVNGATDIYTSAAQKGTIVKRNPSTGGINVGALGVGPLAADASGSTIIASTAPAGHTGNLFEGLVSGASKFAVGPGGNLTALGVLNLGTPPTTVSNAAGLLDATKHFGILPTANGGTGLASPAAHSLLIGNGASAMTALAAGTAGYILTSNGAGADPSWQASAGGGGGGGIATTTAVVTIGDYSATYANSRDIATVLSGASSDGDLFPSMKRTSTGASLADALRASVSGNLIAATTISGADTTKMQIVASTSAPVFVSVLGVMRVITSTVTTPTGATTTTGIWKLVADLSAPGPGFTIALLSPSTSPTATQFLIANVWFDGTQLQTSMIDFSPITPLLSSRNVRFDFFKQVSSQFNAGANITLGTAGSYTAIPGAPISTIFPSSAVNGFIWWRANVIQGSTPHVVAIAPYEISGSPSQVGDAVDARGIAASQIMTVSGFAPLSYTSPGQRSFQLYVFADSIATTAPQLNGLWMMGFFTA
jgi:hypothetical protein